jgi:hypothetical protein
MISVQVVRLYPASATRILCDDQANDQSQLMAMARDENNSPHLLQTSRSAVGHSTDPTGGLSFHWLRDLGQGQRSRYVQERKS